MSRVLLTLLICFPATPQAKAADAVPPDAPFVAAFERFYTNASSESSVGGRLLLSELSCTACHTTDDAELRAKGGPRLDAVGSRLQAAWVRRFLESPQTAKPGTTMPDVLHGLPAAERTRAVEALTAFLSARRRTFPMLNSTAGNPIAFEFWRKGDRERGAKLYHELGCVACHAADVGYSGTRRAGFAFEKLLEQLDPQELEELGLAEAAKPVRSVAHGDLKAKYTYQSLTHFLLDPLATRPAGRMPDMGLRPDEAAAITAHLLRGQRPGAQNMAPNAKTGLIEEGRRLFVRLGCVNCHSVDGVKPSQQLKPLAGLDLSSAKSCIADPTSGLPRYPLSRRQQEALRQSAAPVTQPTAVGAAASRVSFRMQQLNCYACHERDGRGGVGPRRRGYFEVAGHVDLGDEGRLPPPLTGVGGKLTQPWIKKVLDGAGAVRPHMQARMPKFGATATNGLPEVFVKADLHAAVTEAEVFGDVGGLAEAGRALMDAGCVQCHPFRAERMPGVVGIDLAGIPQRVQPEWFYDFLLNPGQLKPRTRMPTFFPDGRSANQSVLEGDVKRQLAAMWAYLKDLPKQHLPQKLLDSKEHDFELVPTDKPIVLRTFMKSAGTHAIAVGFPQQVHLSFDAESVRPIEAWRGRFLDAHGTWFDRFTPPAVPLGTDLVAFPAGVPLARLDDQGAKWPTPEEAAYRFRGYRLDKAGTPTFLYRYGRFDIEDRFSPAGQRSLVRRLHVTTRPPNREPGEGPSKPLGHVSFRANTGQRLQRTSPVAMRNDAGLTVSIPQGFQAISGLPVGVQRQADDLAEWIVSAEMVDATVTIEVKYEW